MMNGKMNDIFEVKNLKMPYGKLTQNISLNEWWGAGQVLPNKFTKTYEIWCISFFTYVLKSWKTDDN